MKPCQSDEKVCKSDELKNSNFRINTGKNAVFALSTCIYNTAQLKRTVFHTGKIIGFYGVNHRFLPLQVLSDRETQKSMLTAYKGIKVCS